MRGKGNQNLDDYPSKCEGNMSLMEGCIEISNLCTAEQDFCSSVLAMRIGMDYDSPVQVPTR